MVIPSCRPCCIQLQNPQVSRTLLFEGVGSAHYASQLTLFKSHRLVLVYCFPSHLNPTLSFVLLMQKNIPKKSPGFGFGQAMFAMKDLTSEYASFNDEPVNIPPPKVRVPVQIHSKPQQKTGIIQKPQETFAEKPGFKINPGKEFESKMQVIRLKATAAQDRIFELTDKEELSKWPCQSITKGVPACQIVAGPVVDFNFSAFEMKQGSLGDCYFICALAGFMKMKSILQQRVPLALTYGQNQKIYHANLFQSGKNVQVPVENFFMDTYCRPIGNNIAPMVIEKAFAQVYGGYEAIVMGSANDALRDLSGAPTVYLDLKDVKGMTLALEQAFEKRFPVVIASKKNPLNTSISGAHSYNVLDLMVEQGMLYLSLRDPRGWTKASFKVDAKLESNLEMGLFWVNSRDLPSNFEVISICKAYQKASYYYKTFGSKELSEHRGALLVTVKAPGSWSFSIHQKQKKFFGEGFSYDVIRILLASVSLQQGKLLVTKTLDCKFNSQAVCTIQTQLEAGQYVLLGEVGSRKEKMIFPREIFTLSSYGFGGELTFDQIAGKVDSKPFITDYMRQNMENFKSSVSPQGLQRIHGSIFGYVCVYYENRSSKQVVEEIEYTGENFEVSQRKVRLAPGDTKLLMHAIGPKNNCSHQCTLKAKTLYT